MNGNGTFVFGSHSVVAVNDTNVTFSCDLDQFLLVGRNVTQAETSSMAEINEGKHFVVTILGTIYMLVKTLSERHTNVQRLEESCACCDTDVLAGHSRTTSDIWRMTWISSKERYTGKVDGLTKVCDPSALDKPFRIAMRISIVKKETTIGNWTKRTILSVSNTGFRVYTLQT